jgi:hypothetical protein
MIQLNAIVMPCLNEQEFLATSCASLGFCADRTPPANSFLVIVDNGSTDCSLEIAAEIQARCAPGSVVLAQESERGYVPARWRGNQVAGETAFARGIANEKVLILQADSDTKYSDDYVACMNIAFNSSRQERILLKACTKYPATFVNEHRGYLSLCDEVDEEFEELLSDHSEDVVIDDKACAYRLSDYLHWGGHLREFNSTGEDVLSETTRLFLRAKAAGARAFLVDEAVTEHSTRRVIEHPAIDFATAGFPRESSWKRRYETEFKSIDSIALLLRPGPNATLDRARQWRKIHLLGLFGILPLHLARAMGLTSSFEQETWAKTVSLPARSLRDVARTPAILLQDALSAAEALSLT